MQAIILAAGEGSRLRPLTEDRPKPMLPIGGKPLLDHSVCWLRGHGVRHIAINLHYLPEVIPAYFGRGARWDVKLTYSVETSLLGTAGAVKQLSPAIHGTFAVLYGDVLTDMDLGTLAAFHRSSGACLTLSLYPVPNPHECGIVELDRRGRVLRMVEKPAARDAFSNLAVSGVMLAEPEVLEDIPAGRFYDFGFNLIPDLIRRGKPVYGLPIAASEYLIDIGSPGKYARACAEWPARNPASRVVEVC